MSKNIYDFHGLFIDEALQKVDSIISQIRLEGRKEEVTFITGGSGKMGEAVKCLLKECSIEFVVPLNNPGQINATVE